MKPEKFQLVAQESMMVRAYSVGCLYHSCNIGFLRTSSERVDIIGATLQRIIKEVSCWCCERCEKENMAELKFPVVELEKEKFQVVVDMALYAKESVVAACYKFTDRFYIHQQTDNSVVKVVFESKDGNVVSEEIVKQFCNELIDQQVRYNVNLQFGHIRNLIVEEAFKPVNK